MLACEDSTSIDCARVMRGAASSAKAFRPLARHGGDVVGIEGIEHADQRRRRAHQRNSLGRSGRAPSAPCRRRSASAALPMRAPAAT
jgi:hypothetical protein